MKVASEVQETIYGTQGIVDETAFTSYKFGAGEGNWAVEILEGKEYGSENWKRLAYFTIPNDLRKANATAATSE